VFSYEYPKNTFPFVGTCAHAAPGNITNNKTDFHVFSIALSPYRYFPRALPATLETRSNVGIDAEAPPEFARNFPRDKAAPSHHHHRIVFGKMR
jgi:hypothetical protein